MSPLALLRVPQVPRLLVSALVGRLPNGMVPLALVLFARATGESYGRAGLLAAAYTLGCCLGGPALSRVMDLRGPRGGAGDPRRGRRAVRARLSALSPARTACVVTGERG